MGAKVEVKVLELEADKLKAGSKYIFVMDESALSVDDVMEATRELERLLGAENFTFFIINGLNNLKVYSVEE